MLGAIAGDIIGSIYESNNIKTTEFPLFHPACTFTDDTILTIAVAEVLFEGDYGNHDAYIDKYHEWFDRYPSAGFGNTFQEWAWSKSRRPYNSWGNGSAMRVSPIGYAFDTLEETLFEAKVSAEVTHNHPSGIRGAQAVAAAIFLARNGKDKQQIKQWIEENIEWRLDKTIDEIRPDYTFDVSCFGSVPPAIIAFLESNDYEDAIRKAISLGGDSDTIACVTGGIAEAFYRGVPKHIVDFAMANLDLRMQEIVDEFQRNYM